MRGSIYSTYALKSDSGDAVGVSRGPEVPNQLLGSKATDLTTRSLGAHLLQLHRWRY